MDGVVVLKGNVLPPQIQGLRVDGVDRVFNKNVVVLIPEIHRDTGHRQCQNQNHGKQNPQYFLCQASYLLFGVCDQSGPMSSNCNL